VPVGAHDRKRLEQLCRYIARSALSNERMQLNAAGQVLLKLKTPSRDGTTHLAMSPLEFMQQLATLVSGPGCIVRFHGGVGPECQAEGAGGTARAAQAAAEAAAPSANVQRLSRPTRTASARARLLSREPAAQTLTEQGFGLPGVLVQRAGKVGSAAH